MKLRPAALVLAVGLAFTAGRAAPSTTTTETFDGTLDQASWRISSVDVIFTIGGNPGGYLRARNFDQAEPTLVTIPEQAQPFLGDYRAMGVVSLGVDVNLFGVGISADGRPVSLSLTSDMGTPDDTSDDCEAVFVGAKNVPKPGTGWKSFDFKVPSQSATLPQNWVLVGTCAGLPQDDAWNRVIQNVGRASFEFGEPGFFYFFQVWDIGFDNPRIVTTP
jgi:hypothetical protein